MRILFAAALAALIAGGSLSAFAQATGTAPAGASASTTKACKGRAEADCQAPDCVWVAASTAASGKQTKAYCRKSTKAKKAAPAKAN